MGGGKEGRVESRGPLSTQALVVGESMLARPLFLALEAPFSLHGPSVTTSPCFPVAVVESGLDHAL